MLSVKLAEENVPVQVEEVEAPVELMPVVEGPAGPIPEIDPELAAEDNAEPPEQRLKPILYAALLQKKSDATKAIQTILAQAKAEFGSMPQKMIYCLHSDLGGEFLGSDLQAYLLFHGIHHTTTQGYDPSSNGAAENAAGLLRKR